MVMNDTLAAALSKIMNAEKAGKKECTIRPISKVISGVLGILKREGYILDYLCVEDKRGGQINISLGGRINKCNSIKPRFPVDIDSYEKFEKRYLPAKDFGIIIVSTSKGLMTNKEAKEKKVGGRLVSYCY